MKLPLKMTRVVIGILLSFVLIYPLEVAYSQNPTPDEEYQSIIEKIKKGEDRDTDYTKLRMLYTQTSWYQPESKERDENILKMTQAWVDKRYDEAVQLGNAMLEVDFLNPFVHDLFAKICKETGSGDMLFHLLIFISVTSSISESGDGKSFETAYKVISTWEEKGMMNLEMVTPVGQVFEPTLHDGHHYHVIRVKSDETGEESDLYFNIDIPYQKAQQTGPVVTALVTTLPPPTPAFQPITTYTDPSGQFSILFPAGFSLISSQPNLVQCTTPNQGMLYIIISDYVNTLKAFNDEIIKRPGSLSGESQFQAGNLSGKLQLYTMSGSFQVLDGKNYAVLLITYSGVEFGMVVVLPTEYYSAAQSWLSPLITGVQYRLVSSPPVISTPTPAPTLPISTSLEFTAPDGSFRLSLPSGTSKGGEWPNIFEYKTPNQGTLYILTGDTVGILNLFRQDLAKKQGTLQGQPVDFTALGVPGKMEVYTMVGSFQASDGKNYVIILVSYQQPECALVISIPREFYAEAQGWIGPLLTGVTFLIGTPPPTSLPLFTPLSTPTSPVLPSTTPPILETPVPTSIPTPLPTETLPPLTGG